MQIRDIKKQIWMNKTEALSLARKAKQAGLTEAALVRSLVLSYEPKEKPDDRFYDVMWQLSAISEQHEPNCPESKRSRISSMRRNINVKPNCYSSFNLRCAATLFYRIRCCDVATTSFMENKRAACPCVEGCGTTKRQYKCK